MTADRPTPLSAAAIAAYEARARRERAAAWAALFRALGALFRRRGAAAAVRTRTA